MNRSRTENGAPPSMEFEPGLHIEVLSQAPVNEALHLVRFRVRGVNSEARALAGQRIGIAYRHFNAEKSLKFGDMNLDDAGTAELSVLVDLSKGQAPHAIFAFYEPEGSQAVASTAIYVPHFDSPDLANGSEPLWVEAGENFAFYPELGSEETQLVRNKTVARPIHVKEGGRLYVHRGMTLSFAPGAYIYVEGKVLFNGSTDSPILLKPVDGSSPSWAGVMLNGPEVNGSRMKHTHLSGGTGLPAIWDGGFLRPTPFGQAGTMTHGGLLSVANTGAQAEPSLVLERLKFSEARADFGGAMHLWNTHVEAEGLHFESNHATRAGGAVRMGGARLIGNNLLAENNSSAGFGGAVSLWAGADLAMEGLSFKGNTARVGRDVYAIGSKGAESFSSLPKKS